MCTKVVFSIESKMTLFTFEGYFGLYVPKFYLQLNLKWHCLHLTHLTGIVDPLKPLNLISNLFKSKIAFFAFKIRIGEYILCSFDLCVPKLYFQLNLK